MVTSKDVARLAGVSRATVSRAISQPDQVSPDTRERVKWAIKQLDYSPNLMASSLRANRSRTVGVIVNELNNPFYLKIAGMAADTLRTQGYRTMLSFCNEDPALEEDAVNTLLASRAEGIIFSPTCHNPNIDRMLDKHNVFALQLYRDIYPNRDALLIDDKYGTQLATEHLLQYGHRKILVIEHELTVPSGRVPGYQDAYTAAGLQADDRYVLRVPNENNYPIILNFLRNNPTTAVIAPSNDLAVNTLQALKDLNLSIPQDVSVVIYDNLPWAKLMDITCVVHPIEKIHSSVSQAIGRYISGEATESKRYVIRPSLLERGSVWPIR